LIAVRATSGQVTVLTVSPVALSRLDVNRSGVIEPDSFANRKTVETVSGSILSLVTAINRGVNERVSVLLPSICFQASVPKHTARIIRLLTRLSHYKAEAEKPLQRIPLHGARFLFAFCLFTFALLLSASA
jgi:hypothetical protein